MVHNLREMYSRLNDLEDMLASDKRDITGPASYLLPIHHQLHQLEEFCNQTLHQAKKSSADSRAILNRWFERLDTVISEFDKHIGELSHNVLPIVRSGHPEAIVKLRKIAEIEGMEDQKVRHVIIFALSRQLNFSPLVSHRYKTCEEGCQHRHRREI
jgi:exocyst complex component 3